MMTSEYNLHLRVDLPVELPKLESLSLFTTDLHVSSSS